MADAISAETQKLFDQFATQPSTKSPTKALGKDDFLRLLTVQMKYQDPTQPMDNKEMAAQLAQFSSLEQLQNINSTLETMTSSNAALAQSLAQMSLPAMISKTVKANTNAISYNGKDPVSFGYDLKVAAKSVHIDIQDSSGKIVRSFESPAAPGASGHNAFQWDGKDAQGKTVAQGDYKFVVSGKDANANDLTITPIVSGKVTGVRYTGSGAFVIINGAEVSANAVVEVSE